jgi:thiamine biosynthesis lipoprotein ApbE
MDRNSRLLALGFLPLLGSIAWASTPERSDPFAFHEIHVLGTSMDLLVTAREDATAQAVHAAVLGEVERLRKVLSSYDTAADLARVNASQTAVKVGPELLDVLELYERWETASHGPISGRIGGLIEVWRAAEKRGTVPTEAELRAAGAGSAAKGWTIDRAAGTVQRLNGATINVDSLGKGFIVDRALAAARAKVPAAEGILLNIGGDIATCGASLPGRKTQWEVPVADPAHPEAGASPATSLRFTGMAVATSGGYERGYHIGEKNYSHLLDPRSGKALEKAAPGEVAQATVVAADAATANALATALCILPPTEGIALARATEGAECLLILGDGSRMRSAGFSRYEAPHDGPIEKSAMPVLAGPAWLDAYRVSLELQLLPVEGRGGERPYLAMWVEDEYGAYVKTITVWGNNPRWLNSMSRWWRFGKADGELVRATTRATRPAGKYTLAWDGTDQAGRPVTQGTYRLFVEVAYEHAGHSLRSVDILCGPGAAHATLEGNEHFAAGDVSYARKGQ